jgi:hypothetical protein
MPLKPRSVKVTRSLVVPAPILPGAHLILPLLNRSPLLAAIFRSLKDAMTNRKVELEGVQIKKDEKTFFWSGRYHMDMNTAIHLKQN